jgi:hypothetical protein
MEEIWRSIKNYEGLYEISSFGRVKSLKRMVKNRHFETRVNEKILKPGFTGHYYQVHLCKNGKCPLHEVARLVADAFISNPENKPQVNHISGFKLDNNFENLEWSTVSENCFHAYKIGLQTAVGENNGKAKLTEEKVREIRKLYSEKEITQKDLANKYNVTRGAIGFIVRNERWGYLNE